MMMLRTALSDAVDGSATYGAAFRIGPEGGRRPSAWVPVEVWEAAGLP
jgi:hypothetical protein